MVKSTFTKRIFRLVDKIFYKSQNPPKKTAEALSSLNVTRDLSPSEEFSDCKMDLLIKPRASGEKIPVIFYIHGGGFSAGDKRFRDYYCARIANATNCAILNVNHPLGPENPGPIPLKCLVKMANWLEDNAEAFGLDLSKTIVMGDSSGAYYAAMLAAIQGSDELQKIYGEMRHTFTAGLFNCAIFDLVRSIKHPVPLGFTRGVCKDITNLKPKEALTWEYMPFACPVDHVSPAFPKSLLIYSKLDFFAWGQAEEFIEKLEKNGVPYEEYHSTHFLDNHAFSINLNNKVARAARKKMIDFITGIFGE